MWRPHNLNNWQKKGCFSFFLTSPDEYNITHCYLTASLISCTTCCSLHCNTGHVPVFVPVKAIFSSLPSLHQPLVAPHLKLLFLFLCASFYNAVGQVHTQAAPSCSPHTKKPTHIHTTHKKFIEGLLGGICIVNLPSPDITPSPYPFPSSQNSCVRMHMY